MLATHLYVTQFRYCRALACMWKCYRASYAWKLEAHLQLCLYAGDALFCSDILASFTLYRKCKLL